IASAACISCSNRRSLPQPPSLCHSRRLPHSRRLSHSRRLFHSRRLPHSHCLPHSRRLSHICRYAPLVQWLQWLQKQNRLQTEPTESDTPGIEPCSLARLPGSLARLPGSHLRALLRPGIRPNSQPHRPFLDGEAHWHQPERRYQPERRHQ
ncbi:hypothetical protein BD626DRAFT_586874, partial [Schizophyllum amplum]